MAFCSRIGSLYMNSISQNSHTLSIGHVLKMSMLNVIRHMETSCKIYVGGLPWAVKDQSLRDAFASFGEVVDAKVLKNIETGRSRGFGFVSFSNPESASSAIASMDGKEMDGRMLQVNFAIEKPTFEDSRGGGDSGSYICKSKGYGGSNAYCWW